MNLQNLRSRYEEYRLGRIFEEIKNYAKNAVEISLKEKRRSANTDRGVEIRRIARSTAKRVVARK